MEIDTSTINREALGRLQLAQLPPTHHIDRHMGSACYGDPPGFPSYFVQHVYTQHGNSPTHPEHATSTILGRVLERARDDSDKREVKLRALWSPLPIDHPRTVAWIRDTYRHMARCYSVPDRLEYGRPKTLIAGFDEFLHRTFQDDPRFSDDWRIKERAAIDAHNHDVDEQWARIAIPDNHCAVRRIREFYQEHAPDLELIAHPPTEVEGDWWTRLAAPPTPEECPGDMGHPHPVNGTWCQFCGWHGEGTVRP